MKKITKTYSNFAFTILISSYILGFAVWVWAVITAYINAGLVWTIIGVLFIGVGVILVAIVSTALNNLYITSAAILFSFIFVIAIRSYAKSLARTEVTIEN